MNYRIIKSGYCPEANRENAIAIVYAEIPISGQLAPGIKKLSFSCEYHQEHRCSIVSACPVFKQAQI